MIDYLRKTSEALILLLVVVTPWAFGCVHPYFKYLLTAGICAVLALWCAELLVKPSRQVLTRFQLPLIGLLGIACIQIIPLGSLADSLSPKAAEWKQIMLPEQIEKLANGEEAQIPAMTARGRISLYPAETRTRLIWFALLALLFTRVQDLADPTTLRRLCLTCLINGSILAYFSVIQHFSTQELGKIYWTFQSMGTAFGPFINRNHFAFYTNICFGLSLGLVGSRQMGKFTSFSLQSVIETLKDSVTLWMFSVLVFMLGAVILCSSRGGMISLLGSLLITAAFVAATGSFKQGWKWFLLAAAIFAIGAGIQMWLGFDFVDSRYTNNRDGRLFLWKPLLTLVRHFPTTGIGLGSLAQIEPSTRQQIGPDHYLEYAHNEYLQLAIELGFPGLLFGLLLLWFLSSKIASRVRKSRHNAWLYVGLLFALTSVALHSITEFGLAIPAIAFLAAVALGHIAGVGRVRKKEALPIWHQSLQRIGAIAILGFCFLAMRDAKLADLAYRSQLSGQRAGHKGDKDAELAHYIQSVHYQPNEIEKLLDVVRIRLRDRYDSTAGDLALLTETQQAIIRARELSPMKTDPHSYLGRYHSTFKRVDAPLSYYNRAMMTRPKDPQLKLAVGEIFRDRGDKTNAAKMFRESLQISPAHVPEIVQHIKSWNETFILREVIPNGIALVPATAADQFEKLDADTSEDQTPRFTTLINVLRKRALDSPELKNASSGDSFRLKALLYTKLEETDQAIQAFNSALRFEPQRIDWRVELARLHSTTAGARERGYEEALRELKRVLQQSPNYTRAIRLKTALLEDLTRSEIPAVDEDDTQELQNDEVPTIPQNGESYPPTVAPRLTEE